MNNTTLIRTIWNLSDKQLLKVAHLLDDVTMSYNTCIDFCAKSLQIEISDIFSAYFTFVMTWIIIMTLYFTCSKNTARDMKILSWLFVFGILINLIFLFKIFF